VSDAGEIRAQPLSAFAVEAQAIADSKPVISTYAAPEWAELDENGQQWVCAIVRETQARAVEEGTARQVFELDDPEGLWLDGEELERILWRFRRGETAEALILLSRAIGEDLTPRRNAA
jgi:hypothetical protein